MPPSDIENERIIRSMLCQETHFKTDWYRYWDSLMGFAAGRFSCVPKGIPLHRKFWEWAAIAQALDERGFLQEGRSALGFAVGTEPLSSLFAKRNVEVLATDLGEQDPDTTDWSSTNQHASALDVLHSNTRAIRFT